MNRSTALAYCLSALALIAAAAPVHAGAGEMRGGDYEGDPGVNNVTASWDGTRTTFTDTAGITNIISGFAQFDCTPLSATSVSCPYQAYGYQHRLGPGNDSFTYLAGAPLPGVAAGNNFFSVMGGAGADVLNGSEGDDEFSGDGSQPDFSNPVDPAGDDQLYGHGGDDTLTDYDGSSNRFEGGSGSDRLVADNNFNPASANTMIGGPGNDHVHGGEGTDTVDGEDGDDYTHGGGGADQVRGGVGDDDVEGGEGPDISDGGPGNDDVAAPFHGSACDTDTLIGGSGVDSFYVACGVPTLKFRDGEADTGRCLKGVTGAVKEYDKNDNASGGSCQTFITKCKKKKGKKGKSASAAKKKKKKRCTQEPYKPPDPDA